MSEDDKLLDELTYLSAELARLVAETRYRMSATRAYAQLSSDRLASLRIGAVRGHQTLVDFTERRLTPAVRTCDSFSARLEDLSQRAAWTSELLRTRIDIALAKQNRDLLTSMDQRTHLQLRLQQTVEGLSVVAISYYLVALVGYLLGAVPGLRHDWAMAAAGAGGAGRRDAGAVVAAATAARLTPVVSGGDDRRPDTVPDVEPLAIHAV